MLWGAPVLGRTGGCSETSRFFVFALIACIVATKTGITPVAFAQNLVPTASPIPVLLLTASPTPTKPPTIIPYCIADAHLPDACKKRQRIIYVIGVANDYATRGRLVATLTDQLQDFDLIDGARLISEPSWSTDDFINQCEADRNRPPGLSVREGALVIAAVALANGLSDRWSHWWSSTEAAVNVLYAECALGDNTSKTAARSRMFSPVARRGNTTLRPKSSPTPSPSPSPPAYAYIWSSHTQFGHDGKSTTNMPRYFSLVSQLLTLAAIYAAVAPTKTYKSTTVTNFPTPAPSTSPPASWLVSMTSESDSSNSSFATLTGAFLTQATQQYTVVSIVPADDANAWNAIEGAVYNIVNEMHCPTPTSAPSAKPTSPPNDDVKKFAEATPVPLPNKAPFCLQQ